MTLWYREGLYDLARGAQKRRRGASFVLLPSQGSLKWVQCSHHTRETSGPRHWPRLPSVRQYPFTRLPAGPCFSVSVFFPKCSWHFVYLSFKHSAKIMSENEKKKPSIFHLFNLLQGKQFSTTLKTRRTFQDAQKSLADCWAKAGL